MADQTRRSLNTGNNNGLVEACTKQNAKIVHVFELKKYHRFGNKWQIKAPLTADVRAYYLIYEAFLDEVDKIFERRSFGGCTYLLIWFVKFLLAIGTIVGAICGWHFFVVATGMGVAALIIGLLLIGLFCIGCIACAEGIYVSTKIERQKLELNSLVEKWNDESNGKLPTEFKLKLDDFFWEGMHPPEKHEGGLTTGVTTIYIYPSPKIYVLHFRTDVEDGDNKALETIDPREKEQ